MCLQFAVEPFFVMENVAALGRLAKFEAIRKRLLECYSRMGYAVRFEILDSQHYKTPSRYWTVSITKPRSAASG